MGQSGIVCSLFSMLSFQETKLRLQFLVFKFDFAVIYKRIIMSHVVMFFQIVIYVFFIHIYGFNFQPLNCLVIFLRLVTIFVSKLSWHIITIQVNSALHPYGVA